MTAVGRLALTTLLVAVAGCTFERRPAADEAEGGEPGPDGAARSAAVDPAARTSAREALDRLQAARATGDADRVRGWMSEDAVVLRSGVEVPWGEVGSGADSLLAPGAATGDWTLRVPGRPLGDGRLFVVGYPEGGSGAGAGALEILLLAPRPDDGWRVRLLHRTPVP